MEITDRRVPADPDVPLRICHPQRAQGAIIWLHGGGFVMGDLETEHPWAVQIAAGSGAAVVSVGYRLAPSTVFRPPWTTPAPRWPGRRSTQPNLASTRGASR
jgi:acetyl esterase